MFLTVIATIIFLSLLIIIHEFGHFITSKFFGLKVEEFGIGFPPRVFSKKKGDTVYSVNALPFGGFVKILGENRVENAGLTEEEKKKSFSAQTAWRKTSIIIAGIIMNFIAGWFIISWLFFVGIPSNGVLISAISPDTPAATAGFTIGDLVTKINSAGKIVSPKNADEFAVFINEFRGEQLSFSVNRIGKIIELNAVPRKNPPPGEGPLGVNVATTGIDNRPFI
ncbi:MAG: site-2 protease family protein, partial [Parcubacteria group bacterium]|nr:site-2 protease family protein [Parcubacteria group bacterium]